MGRKMDALLRRGFRASKFSALANLAISRLATLKNQRQVRSANARFDVIQLLKLGFQDRALLRVEYVIKELNMLDVFVMIEDFILLLTERLVHLQDNKECPDELEEAVSSLIFAATRCGEFPELKRLRQVFTSRFGKDFVASAAQLHSNCKVNFKMIQKLLARQPTLEQRLHVLNEIASANGITLHLEDVKPEQKQTTSYESAHLYKAEAGDEMISESIKVRKFGVADAAPEGCEAAAYVEFYRAGSQDTDQDDQELVVYESKPLHDDGYATPEEIKNSADDGSSSEAETERTLSVSSHDSDKAETERTLSVSSHDSDKDTKMDPNLPIQSEPLSDDSDKDSKVEPNLPIQSQPFSEIQELPYESPNQIHLKAQAESMDHLRFESSQSSSDFEQRLHAREQHSGMDRKLLSVRTVPVLRG